MKNLKAKLLISVAMVLVAAVMMTTASFAWFTLSTNPSIENISGQVAANGNLEIALGTPSAESKPGDTTDYYTWGNLVDLASITFATPLEPVYASKTSSKYDGTFKEATFGTDGRLTADTAFPALTEAVVDTGKSAIKSYTGSKVGVMYSVTFSLRSNVAGTVSLCAAADRGNGTNGQGSTISDSRVHVLFAVPGTSATTYVEATNTSGVLSGDICTLEANKALTITAYFFVDAETETNKTLTNTPVTDLKVNLQFAHSVALDGLENDLTASSTT